MKVTRSEVYLKRYFRHQTLWDHLVIVFSSNTIHLFVYNRGLMKIRLAAHTHIPSLRFQLSIFAYDWRRSIPGAIE